VVRRRAWLLVFFACGGPPPPADVGVAKSPPGSISKPCNGVEFWVSSGNGSGSCRAAVDDTTGRLRAMTCDDGHRNAATLACSTDGHVSCAAAGTGLCATDLALVHPVGSAAAKLGYFAYKCGQDRFYLALAAAKDTIASCLPTFDRATGASAMHCDDGAGDSAEFVCRDGVGACSFTGTGTCGSDETQVRK
jgi:hypothetical protein